MRGEPHIRRATPADVDAVTELVRRCYEHYIPAMGRPPAPMEQDYADVIGDAEAWVAEIDKKITGLLVLRNQADHMLLENVAVTPESQGTGLGARLIEVAERRAHEQGFAQVRLYTNAAMATNLAWYPRRGYTQTHRVTQDGFDRVFFAKEV